MDALTWGGGLVVRNVAKESVDFVWGRRNWRRSFLTTLRVGGFCRCSSSRNIVSFTLRTGCLGGEIVVEIKDEKRKSLGVCMIVGKLRVGLGRYVQKHLLLTSKHA